MPPSGRGDDAPSPRASSPDLSGRGTARRARVGAPYLVPTAVVVAAAAAAWLWRASLASWATTASPETQVRDALSRQDRVELSDVYGFRAGGTAELQPVRFLEVVPTVDAGRASVVAMVEAEGRATWRDQQTRISYVGRERFRMRVCGAAGWCGEGDELGRLSGVLLALFRRHDAEERRDLAGYDRLLSAAYRDGGEDRAAAVRRLERTLPAPPPPVAHRRLADPGGARGGGGGRGPGDRPAGRPGAARAPRLPPGARGRQVGVHRRSMRGSRHASLLRPGGALGYTPPP